MKTIHNLCKSKDLPRNRQAERGKMEDLFLIKEFTNANIKIKIQKRIGRKDKIFSLCSSIGKRVKIRAGFNDNTLNPNIGYFDIRLNLKGHEYVLSIDLNNNL